MFFYGLPTYRQAKKLGWEKINALIPDEWVVKNGRNKSELTITTIFGSRIDIIGLDKPFRVEGDQYDGGVLDECSDQKPETYTKTILPMLTHRNGWCWRIGVPKRNGCGAIAFKEAFDLGLEPNSLGLESYTWPSTDILTPEQIEQQIGQMTAKDAEEQFGGIWVESEGQIFYAFNEAKNVSTTAAYNSEDVIGVGCDFNVNPMAWVLFHVHDGNMYVFDEIWLRNTNTQEALNHLYNQYGGHYNGWLFIGDATSRARKTAAAMSDYIQIQNDDRFRFKRVHFPKSNPLVADRFAATNAMLCNALQLRRLFINPKCKNLRSDLQQRSYKVGTREVDDSAPDSGHITDALGYPISVLFPLSSQTNDGGIGIVGNQTEAYTVIDG